MLTIYNSLGDSFSVDKEGAHRLEIALNLSEKGREWSDLGDVLYECSCGRYEGVLTIEPHKFNFLLRLTKM